jgi:DNA mismatch repair ATPase MutS
MPKWRQHFSAMASLTKVQYSADLIVDWIHNYKSVFPKFLSVIPILFSTVSLMLMVLLAFNTINFQVIVIWFFIGLGFSGLYLKKVNSLYEEATKAKDTFRQYHKLLDKIEMANFTSSILKEKQQVIQRESQKASQIFAQFSKILDALDQRNNLLIAIVANGLLLRDLKISVKIEKWIEKYHDQVENWFEDIAFFDAQISLANYAFNHPKAVYPKIRNADFIINASNLGHPLIKQEERISNNFNIKNQNFYIVTGANMAGKSTFLRTVSISIVMANAGLPVCAETYEYVPIKLITSMRTSDSLADDESYFFSELKRLKFIVDTIDPSKSEEKYFIILDEILKGTNSTDKAIGSKKFVKKLVASNSTGIIATHDLSLCEIEKHLEQIKNYYFDAQIIDDELHFDYKLKDGICKNMNASFLLKKMEIV